MRYKPRVLTCDDRGVLVAVRVVPNAARTEITGERAGRLVIRITAPPLEGRANDAVRRLLAKVAGVGASRVQVVSGERARHKTVRIDGISMDEMARRLG